MKGTFFCSFLLIFLLPKCTTFASDSQWLENPKKKLNLFAIDCSPLIPITLNLLHNFDYRFCVPNQYVIPKHSFSSRHKHPESIEEVQRRRHISHIYCVNDLRWLVAYATVESCKDSTTKDRWSAPINRTKSQDGTQIDWIQQAMGLVFGADIWFLCGCIFGS